MHTILSMFMFFFQSGETAAQSGTLDQLKGYVIPVIVVALVIGVFALIVKTIVSFYVVVQPDEALVVSGRGQFEVITGGAKLVWPVINKSFRMNLRAFQVRLELQNAPNADRIPIDMVAMATCKISKEQEMLKKAAENFGDKNLDQISEIIFNALEGHLRIVIGQINMNTILSARDQFNAKIQSEAATELAHLGVSVTMLNILQVSDPNGTIDALGKPMIAQIKADAAISEADQLRRETVEVTNSQREGALVKNENEAKIAEADRDRQTKTLTYDATVKEQQAKTDQAGPLSDAIARQAVVEAEVAVEERRAEAETKLQAKIGTKNEAEYAATIQTKAEAEKKRVVTEAEGSATARNT